MSVADVSRKKARSKADFQMTTSQMVLEVVSLLCIVASLAIVGMIFSDISPWTLVIPALILLVYLLVGLAARYPQQFPRLNNMAHDSMGQYQNTRETLAWLKTEAIWTLLCVQAILALAGVLQDGTTRIAVVVGLCIIWVLINGLLLWLISRVAGKQ